MSTPPRRTIACIGYIERPVFDYPYPVDRRQIESMRAARDDRILMVHWDDIDAALCSSRVWDLPRGSWIAHDLATCDALVILECPYPESQLADFAHSRVVLQAIADRGMPAVNAPQTFLSFPDKRYLVERSDMPFPRGGLVTATSDLAPLLADLGDAVVLKPVSGLGGKGVVKLPNDPVAIRPLLQAGREYLLQEFLPAIAAGETSLYFIAKQYRYAVVKRPRAGGFLTNEEWADHERHWPDASEIAFARDAIERFGSPSLIERVDICGRHIIEMTVGCPGLMIKTTGTEREIGPWTYEAIDMAIANARRGIT